MSGIWTDLLQRPHVVEALGSGYELEGRHTAWPIPARVDEISLTHGRVMFVGDAAAATDVMTGEGIGQALLTGRLAAEAIVEAGALDADLAMRHYERSVDHHLFADHRMSVRLGKVLASRRGTEVALRIVQRSGAWGKAQLRPVDVRGRTSRRRPHPDSVASGVPRPARRLFVDRQLTGDSVSACVWATGSDRDVPAEER